MLIEGQERPLFQKWILEDSENIYLFDCGECAFIWMIENKPEFVDDETARSFGECRSGHKTPAPYRIIKKAKTDA